jgi:hypothetical protein
LPEPGLTSGPGAPARSGVGTAWRDAAEAGLRYYGRLGSLALELTAQFVPAIGDFRPAAPRPAAPEPEARALPGADETPAGPATTAAPTIVVEAAAGKSGLGVFMVENTAGEKVSAPVGVSAFVDAGGREVDPEVTFSPGEVSLEPGDQVLVQVVAAVDETLEPGVRYQGEISIPRLSGATIPLVVRRREETVQQPAKKRAGKPAKKSPRS